MTPVERDLVDEVRTYFLREGVHFDEAAPSLTFSRKSSGDSMTQRCGRANRSRIGSPRSNPPKCHSLLKLL